MTANEAYRNYKKQGGTLSFADYMTREKKKKFMNFNGPSEVPTNKPLSDSISNLLNEIRRGSGYKDKLENKYIFGINRNVLIGVGVVVVVVTAIIVYKKTTK